MTDLYVYLCGHNWSEEFRPGQSVQIGPCRQNGLVWMTDMASPDTKALLPYHVGCGQDVHRLRVTPQAAIQPWVSYALKADPALVWDLELRDGVQPEHWWVCPTYVVAVVDEDALA